MTDKRAWKDWRDDELADEAQTGVRGQGAVVEALRRLRESTNRLTWALIVLTIVMVILMVVQILSA